MCCIITVQHHDIDGRHAWTHNTCEQSFLWKTRSGRWWLLYEEEAGPTLLQEVNWGDQQEELDTCVTTFGLSTSSSLSWLSVWLRRCKRRMQPALKVLEWTRQGRVGGFKYYCTGDWYRLLNKVAGWERTKNTCCLPFKVQIFNKRRHLNPTNWKYVAQNGFLLQVSSQSPSVIECISCYVILNLNF